MRLLPRFLLLTLLATVVGCASQPRAAEVATPTAAPVTVRSTAFEVAQQYLLAWHERRYGDMYALLAQPARQSIARERFIGRYTDIAEEATITGVNVEIVRPDDDDSERIRFTAVLTTALWGDLREDNTLPLVKEAEGWRVEWTPSLIFRNLSGVNLVRTVIDAPKRGAIYDRHGKPLATTGSVAVVGTAKNLLLNRQSVPDREAFIRWLGERITLSPDDIRKKLDDPKIDNDIFIALKTMPPNTPEALISELENSPGVLLQQAPRRLYPLGAAAAHLTGYVAPITAEQLEKLRGEGYTQTDLIGAAGLEASMERQLAGQRGARLTFITPEGVTAYERASRPGRPAVDVVTAIDSATQLAASQALGERVGSAVLLDPRDNGVIALVSSPTYDPNAFITGLTAAEGSRLLNDQRRPLLNRPVAATYPPGSTFKVITGAAGIERGGYTASSRFPCPPVWTGLGPANAKRNWNKVDEGALTIAEGLMRSCNPVFYDIAVRLDSIDANILPSITGGFGIGKPTGIVGLDEAEGVNPGPEWKKKELGEAWFTGDSVNMSIGQGYVLATPLQVANAYSAIAQGGSLRKPVLVRELREQGGAKVLQRYEPEELGKLPIGRAALDAIRQGATMVAQDPRGTAFSVFRGSAIDPAGKSGTAEDQGVQSHALFAAYAPRANPRGVAVVVFDEGESGSLEAGPITRRILEAWLSARP